MVLLFGCGASPAARADQTGQKNDVVAVSIRHNANFADLGIQLQALVNTLGFHTVNYFCVIAYETKGDPDQFVVPDIYWPTQDKLIEWGIASHLILDSTFYFDLSRDILPDGAVTNDYWHRSDVDQMIRDCREYGDSYTVRKTEGGWVPIRKFSQFLSRISAGLPEILKTHIHRCIGRQSI